MSDDDELPYVRTIISFQPLTNFDMDFKSLLDSGATHSFIQLNVLPIYVQQEITKYIRNPTKCNNKLNISLMDVIIQTATDESRSLCALLKVHLNLHGWQCSHEFIVSNQIAKHSVILGYDFIRRYKVDVTNPRDFFTRLRQTTRNLNSVNSLYAKLKLFNLNYDDGNTDQVAVYNVAAETSEFL